MDDVISGRLNWLATQQKRLEDSMRRMRLEGILDILCICIYVYTLS